MSKKMNQKKKYESPSLRTYTRGEWGDKVYKETIGVSKKHDKKATPSRARSK